MTHEFEMVAKTMQGLEEVLAEELRNLGAKRVQPGRRMVAFEGDLELLYKANLCCRTALRILKPISKFIANDPDSLYDMVKQIDWGQYLTIDKAFSVDVVAFSDVFTHSQYVTYRVKDAIVDWFKDRFGDDKRPGVRLQDADVIINVHIDGDRVTISLDSSGQSLHKRGYRVAQTEAPINEVLAAGIILRSGWRGDSPLVDPMCGSGTFLIEAALIAANINPGVYRKNFAFENWRDFDSELFTRLYNDDSGERDFNFKIYGADISPKAVAIARENIKAAGVGRFINLECRPLSSWEEAPEGGVLITNPPYGERISVDDMTGLYSLIGEKLKKVFKGYNAWIIAYRKELFDKIGLAASEKIEILNGSLECELRQYVIFEGTYSEFRKQGGSIKSRSQEDADATPDSPRPRRQSDAEWQIDARRKGFGGKDVRRKSADRKPNALEQRYAPTKGRFAKKSQQREEEFDRNRDRFDRFDRRRKFGRDEAARERFAASGVDAPQIETPRQEDENPLARRRNIDALKMLQGKRPSLVGEDGKIMRSRRGWKRPDADPTGEK